MLKNFIHKPVMLGLLAVCFLTACTDEPVQFPQVSEVDRAQAMEKWQRSCALCHVDGNGGAPKMGDRKAWGPRIAQSEAELLEHTIHGLGRMPPLGYCMDCSKQDFLVMTEFMSGGKP